MRYKTYFKWVLLHLIGFGAVAKSQPYYVGEMEKGGKCTMNFQVWTPDESLVRQLQNLEIKIENASLISLNRYLKLANEISSISSFNQNITGFVEKELLKCSLDDAKQDVDIKNLNIELRTEVNRLLDRLNQFPRDTTGNNIQPENLNRQIVSTVNNIKSEWIYMKRDVHETKTKTTLLQTQLQNVHEDTGELKSSIDDLQVTTRRLADKQRDFESLLDALQKDYVESGVFVGGELPIFAYDDGIQNELHELKGTVYGLSQRLDAVEFDRVTSTMSATTTKQPVPEIAFHVRKHASNDQGQETLPRDCHDIYRQGLPSSGVYQISPIGASQMENVYCEMFNGTGWTVFQRREDGQTSFDRAWMEYQHGFGSLYGEFWLGNEILHKITQTQKYVLRIDMWDWDGIRFYTEYETFRVGSEATSYQLTANTYSGTAGDSLHTHDGMAFSTSNRDNDLHTGSCADQTKSGWWFASCYKSNLNGIYHTGWYNQGDSFADGVVWSTLKNSDFYSLKRVVMKIRPFIL